MANIKQLLGVNNIEVDKDEGILFIEREKNDGVSIDLNSNELMHLLDQFTDEEYGPDAIYGLERIDGIDEAW